jgi:hypothetical protein
MKWLLNISLAGMILLSACQSPTDWRPHFESQIKAPYGTYVLSKELDYLFPDAYTDVIKGKTEEYIDDYMGYDGTTFFYVNKSMYPDSSITCKLLDLTRYSNSLFFATNDRNAFIYKQFGITLKQIDTPKYKLSITSLVGEDKSFNVSSRQNKIDHFDQIPEGATVLGYISVGDTSYPNYISLDVQFAKGKVYLHANPELYSNYHMLNQADGLYAANSLSHLVHTETLLWDGAYTRRRYLENPSSGSVGDLLRYIRKNPSLIASLLVIAAALVLLLLFNYKRIVKPMALYIPQQNNSMEFMKMVATLFQNEENHIDLGKYRLTYILDKIKNKYYLDISTLDDTFKHKLAEKANISLQDASDLVLQLNKIKLRNYLTKEDFIGINKKIEPYLKQLKLYEK